MSVEAWRPAPIVGYAESYEVSDRGRVRSVARTVVDSLGRERRLKSVLRTLMPYGNYGHLNVRLSHEGVVETFTVHKLVALAFVGPQPALDYEVCHFDGNASNNCATNLRWDTSSGNKQDVLRHGRHNMASRTNCPRRHPLVEPNLVRSQLEAGRRQCLSCARARARVQRHPELVDELDELANRYYAELAADSAKS